MFKFKKPWDPTSLQIRIDEFTTGQCQAKTREGMLRGEIERCIVSSNGEKEVKVFFTWLCEKRSVLYFDQTEQKWKRRLKWYGVERPLGPPFLNVPFTKYNYQPDEERIKMWGGGWGEVYRFFKKEDHTNLIYVDEGYIERCVHYREAFWHIIFAFKKQKERKK